MTYDEQIASDYAKLRNIHRPLLAALISGSGIHAGSKVLELGCGTGNYIGAGIHVRARTETSGSRPRERARSVDQPLPFVLGEALNFLTSASTVFQLRLVPGTLNSRSAKALASPAFPLTWNR